MAGFRSGRVLDFTLGWLFRGFNWTFKRGTSAYTGLVGIALRGSAIALVIYGGLPIWTGARFHARLALPRVQLDVQAWHERLHRFGRHRPARQRHRPGDLWRASDLDGCSISRSAGSSAGSTGRSSVARALTPVWSASPCAAAPSSW